MQSANVDPTITVTVRHEQVTDALRDYAHKKIEGIHLDYPRIIEAKAILDVQKNRHVAEIILFCANHITIDASSETDDMYKSIDETIDKIARRMRKHKTRLLKKHRPKPENTIKHLDEKVFAADFLDTFPIAEGENEGPEPVPINIHREAFRLRTLFKEEAIMELELSDRPFVLYKNARRDVLQIVYRRQDDGEYSVIELDPEKI
ncbi:MAG: ribosome-associated translation inhibitor RaiA [Akkermansiaceae bacterium]|nr:ribosome-associated translation inhibitor RaiA [Akkermansiaceae bacterium]